MKPVSRSISFAKKKRILDLGCGTGDLIRYLDPRVYMGIDINPKFVKTAQNKFPEYTFRIGDIIKDKFPEGKFDYVVIVNVLHHLSDKQMLKLFLKIKSHKGSKKLLIIESKPVGLFSNLLERLDAGDNFRDHNLLDSIIKKNFKVLRSKSIKAPFRTYKYYISECLI